MKRILTVQDISCVGKCSLTVALPIISAMGVEAAVLPTAVLSTHTAFQEGFTFHDLTDEITPIADHWVKEGIGFDAIYTGYLGSFRQLELVSELFDTFGTEDNHIVIDPVMADHGKLYHGFTPEFAASMATLCGKADLILPNLTETAFLLGVPYEECPSEARVKELLVMLTDLGCPMAAITGVSLCEGRVGVMSYNAETKEYFYYDREYLPVAFHGTGDVFASTVVGAMARGRSVEEALTMAVNYTVETIACTMNDPGHHWYGVNFEATLPSLIKALGDL